MTTAEGVKCRRLEVVTNVPSTYRLQEFRVLARVARREGVDFHVTFLSENEPGRAWSYRPDAFPSSLEVGLKVHFGRFQTYLNPALAWRLLKRPPDWTIVGGGWHYPTYLILLPLARLFRRGRTLFWIEGTVGSVILTRSGLPKAVRRWVLGLCRGFVVPGESSRGYLRDLLGDSGHPVLTLKNFVDSEYYGTRVEELRREASALRTKWKLAPEDHVLLIPARLSPEKGVLEFLDVLREAKRSDVRVVLAGDGPQRSDIEAFVARHALPVDLPGHLDETALRELYAAADVLVLPSLREPYGFVAVEALHAALPLLISREIGAFPDVMDGSNGWSFDPRDRASVRFALDQTLDTSRVRLREMGKASRRIARAAFDEESAAVSFLDELKRAFA